ncbi:MAG: c-type cytochrome [Candidatus Tectomicrobia bacterium]|uniref:C-type cytochrome n=1 Tax=Tectimicrobiota bacterium TaxID=2528274 RepID=A0A932GN45_UNCTE|nr:c-type cytochrome [Candidatus Tectomicrobia bacterium]
MLRIYRLFALMSLITLALFLLSLWKDSNREWKKYQDEYRNLLIAKAKDADQRRAAENVGYEFAQVSVAEGARVDRCIMCHRAVEDPRFVDAPQPLRAHPKIPSHPFERFGCTGCHGGDGSATEVQAAHQGIQKKEGAVLPDGRIVYLTEREEPLLPGNLVQASCGSCHLTEDPGKIGAPVLSRGKTLFQEKGCIGCHRVGRIGGKVGPELTFAGEKRSDPEWLLKHFRDPESLVPDSAMPSYKNLGEEELQALTAFVLSLREVPFTLIASAPLQPQTVVALTPPPVPREAHWEAPRNENLRPNPVPASAESVANGKKLYGKYCAGCHGESGKGDGPGAPKDLKPEPANFADPRMMAHEREGGLYWKITRGRGLMPGWEATIPQKDRWDLVNFLRTLPPKVQMPPGMMEQPHGAMGGEKEPAGHMEESRPGGH